jgi:hypothetical protein
MVYDNSCLYIKCVGLKIVTFTSDKVICWIKLGKGDFRSLAMHHGLLFVASLTTSVFFSQTKI